MTTPTYRRARHSVSLPHAHLVFVTKYRRKVFTDTMLTHCQTTMGEVCANLDAEVVEFNGKADHVHLVVAYPPTLAISQLVQRLKGRTAYAARREFTGRVPVPACADTSGPPPTSRPPTEAHPYLERPSTSPETAERPSLRLPQLNSPALSVERYDDACGTAGWPSAAMVCGRPESAHRQRIRSRPSRADRLVAPRVGLFCPVAAAHNVAIGASERCDLTAAPLMPTRGRLRIIKPPNDK